MKEEAIEKGEQHLNYKMEQQKKTGIFDILNNMGKYVTLVPLMGSVVNLNHAGNLVGKWILF